jgi:hypothetical protein
MVVSVVIVMDAGHPRQTHQPSCDGWLSSVCAAKQMMRWHAGTRYGLGEALSVDAKAPMQGLAE